MSHVCNRGMQSALNRCARFAPWQLGGGSFVAKRTKNFDPFSKMHGSAVTGHERAGGEYGTADAEL